MIENLMAAWQFIFEHHPQSEDIMHRIMDPDQRVTAGQFRVWYAEAMEAK